MEVIKPDKVEPGGNGFTWSDRQIAVMTSTGVPVSESTYRIVARFDSGSGTRINFPTVAVDLMTLDRPTVDLPKPDWPWSTERKVVVWFLLPSATALVAYLIVVRRTRRLGRPTP
jgi:hypothetical protein